MRTREAGHHTDIRNKKATQQCRNHDLHAVKRLCKGARISRRRAPNAGHAPRTEPFATHSTRAAQCDKPNISSSSAITCLSLPHHSAPNNRHQRHANPITLPRVVHPHRRHRCAAPFSVLFIILGARQPR